MLILKTELEENDCLLFRDSAIDQIIDMPYRKPLVIPWGIKYVVVGGILRYKVLKGDANPHIDCVVLIPTFVDNVIVSLTPTLAERLP